MNKLEHQPGYIFFATAVLMLIFLIDSLMTVDAIWMIVYEIIYLLYAVLEWLFDYRLKLPFRNIPKLLVPYIILYILSFWGLIAISFTIEIFYGIGTSIVYIIHTTIMIYYRIRYERHENNKINKDGV